MPQDDTAAVRLAELTSENNGLKQAKSELTARAEKAEHTLAALTAEVEALKAAATARREQDIKSLFAATGKPTEGEAYTKQAALYLALSDEAFTVISADLRAARENVSADENLFTELALGGSQDSPAVAPVKLMPVSDLYAKRRQAGSK